MSHVSAFSKNVGETALWADPSQYLRGHFYAKNGETKNAKPNL